MTQAPLPEAHHEHPEHLAHHFESLQQQYDSGKFGIWLFLTTEILMFSGLFCGYAVLRSLHPEIFLYAHHYLSVPLGALNTAVLIFSSFTMAWGVRAAQLGQTRLLVRLLAITLACAFVFLGVKFVEYKEKWEEALLPGKYYTPSEPPKGMDMPSFEAEKDKTAGKAAEKSADSRRLRSRQRPPCRPAPWASDRRLPPRPSAPPGFPPLGSIAINSAAIAMSCGTARSRTTCSSSSASISP